MLRDGREAVAIGPAIALVVVGAAPVIVGSPGRGRGNEQQAAAPAAAGAGRRMKMCSCMSAPRPSSVPWCGRCRRPRASPPDWNLKRDGPAAARDRAIIRRVPPAPFEPLAAEDGHGLQSVTDDLDRIAGALVQTLSLARGARRIGEAVRVAPDADRARRRVEGAFGVIAEHGLAPPGIVTFASCGTELPCNGAGTGRVCCGPSHHPPGRAVRTASRPPCFVARGSDFCLICASPVSYDEPEILPSSSHPIRLRSADAGQATIAARLGCRVTGTGALHALHPFREKFEPSGP